MARIEEDEKGNWNTENESCNIHVDLPDGRHYRINVWTYQFLQTAVKLDQQQRENLGGMYIVPTDLFVKRFSRECIESTIQDLLRLGDLERY